MKRSLVVAIGLLIAGCAPKAPPTVYVTMPGAVKRPFSAAVIEDGKVYLSGQIGTDSTGQIVPGGIAAETRQTLENIRALLATNGSSIDNVVKCTVFLADMKEWPAMNEVYATFFTQHFPARSAFGTTGLALGARVEIECWATQNAH